MTVPQGWHCACIEQHGPKPLAGSRPRERRATKRKRLARRSSEPAPSKLCALLLCHPLCRPSLQPVPPCGSGSPWGVAQRPGEDWHSAPLQERSKPHGAATNEHRPQGLPHSGARRQPEWAETLGSARSATEDQRPEDVGVTAMTDSASVAFRPHLLR